MQRIVLLTGAVALSLFCASAFAQEAAKAPKQRTAASIECSSQADAKGLHGKARKQFRSRCMREMAAKTGKGKGGLGYR
ncbi:MAG: phosphate starvation-inducible protein PsiF [Hyphomicrobiaceae bacterium]|nr:phosphate starvation-inducible protein PsiF [Hyphomicrobiaceae bacterium]